MTLPIQNELLAHADAIDLAMFENLPVAPIKLSDDQVEQLIGVGPSVLAQAAHDGTLDAPPDLTVVGGPGFEYMIVASPGMDDIVAAYDQDLDRWLILTAEAGTRYLLDPGCIRELDREDIVSAHREKDAAIAALCSMAGPTMLDRVERAAAEYARSACLAMTAASSLALWVKSENDAQAIADAELAAFAEEQALLGQPVSLAAE